MAATECYDAAALARAMSRHAAARERAGQMASRMYGLPGASRSAESDVRVRYAWHLWCSLPSQWRHDLTWPDGQTIVTVIRPDASLSYISGLATLYTSELPPASELARAQETSVHLPTRVANELANFALLNPRLFTSDWELVTLSREEFIGRVVRRVRATRRTGAAISDALDSGHWPGVDEYECLIDDSLRMILRLTGVVDGMCVAATTVERVEVDRPLPTDVFDFMPPAGTRLVHATRSE